jgi:O-antigen/teichoic acid export membrane protein
VEEVDILSKASSGNSIAKNTLFNLLGNVIPIIFAVAFIPPLINGLGTERFGILSLAWMIVGYFSFFDFGIGRGLTKIVAERIGLNQKIQIAEIFWSSIILMILAGLLISIVVSFFVPTLTSLFNISEKYQQETIATFFLLTFSIPVVTTMAGLRGMLEAYQKFATINLLKVFLGAFTFLGPLLVLLILNSLFWIVVFLIVMRIIIWFLYLNQCFKVNEEIKKNFRFNLNAIKPVLRFSIWITIGNLIVPVIMYSDRFLIGVLISAAAITYYVTPYELVTKLMMIPFALTGVLFPIFSAGFVNNPESTKKIFLRGVKFTFLIMYPFVFFLVTFAHEGISVWLGVDFANNSAQILQLLAIGILMNSLSLVPNNFFQGIGKPRIPTLINLVEFPFYILLMWYMIHYYGIKGAAFTFMLMATIDAAAMYITARNMFGFRFGSNIFLILFLIMIAVITIPFFMEDTIIKTIIFVVSISGFLFLTWKKFLSDEEKNFIRSKLKFGT